MIITNLLNQKKRIIYFRMGNKDSSTSHQEIINNLRRQLQDKNHILKNLKNQNQLLISQHLNINSHHSQITVDTLTRMNYSTFTCISCQNFFDDIVRVPIMVCQNQHTVCERCCNQKQNKNQTKCLECQLPFLNKGKNRSILNLITNKKDLVNLLKQRGTSIQANTEDLKLQSQSSEKMKVHLCRYPGYQSMFEMNQDSLLKIGSEDTWQIIRTMQNLPEYQQSEITFKIIHSVHNSIIIGITPQTQQFQKSYIPSTSVAFHLNNGHIYDETQQKKHSYSDQIKMFKWKSGGIPVTKSTNPRIAMNVNLISKKIKWKVQNKLYAEATIPTRFSTQKIYPFIAVYHKGDMIIFNK